MRGIRFIGQFVCLLLLCILVFTIKPAWAVASSFQDQAAPLVEEIRSLQASGENMESLRSDPDKLAACGTTMRRNQSKAEALEAKIGALEVDNSQPNSIKASMAKQYLSSAARNLTLCNSCLSSASESCQQVNSLLKTAMKILKGK